MSHFSLVVFGSDIDEQLAPFAEQGEDPQYREFNDTEDENLEEYNNKTVDIVVLADGSLHTKYANQFRHYGPKEFNSDFRYPEGSIIRKGKFSELYPTFDVFMKEWHGNEERDEEMNRYGYWSNPNAKWDWYSIGGRWTGYFKLKPGAQGVLGESGAFNNQPRPGYTDQCLIKDIDFEGMKQDAIAEANEFYNQLEEVLKGRDLPYWKEIMEKNNGDVEAARAEYNSSEVVQDLNKAKIYTMGCLGEAFGSDRATYVERMSRSSITPFAFLRDGEWCERGEMGWFGCVSDEKDERDWSKEFEEMLKTMPQDTMITLIDCHI